MSILGKVSCRVVVVAALTNFANAETTLPSPNLPYGYCRGWDDAGGLYLSTGFAASAKENDEAQSFAACLNKAFPDISGGRTECYNAYDTLDAANRRIATKAGAWTGGAVHRTTCSPG